MYRLGALVMCAAGDRGALHATSAPRTGLDFAGEFPERLSEWHLLEQRDGKLAPNEGVTAVRPQLAALQRLRAQVAHHRAAARHEHPLR